MVGVVVALGAGEAAAQVPVFGLEGATRVYPGAEIRYVAYDAEINVASDGLRVTLPADATVTSVGLREGAAGAETEIFALPADCPGPAPYTCAGRDFNGPDATYTVSLAPAGAQQRGV